MGLLWAKKDLKTKTVDIILITISLIIAVLLAPIILALVLIRFVLAALFTTVFMAGMLVIDLVQKVDKWSTRGKR